MTSFVNCSTVGGVVFVLGTNSHGIDFAGLSIMYPFFVPKSKISFRIPSSLFIRCALMTGLRLPIHFWTSFVAMSPQRVFDRSDQNSKTLLIRPSMSERVVVLMSLATKAVARQSASSSENVALLLLTSRRSICSTVSFSFRLARSGSAVFNDLLTCLPSLWKIAYIDGCLLASIKVFGNPVQGLLHCQFLPLPVIYTLHLNIASKHCNQNYFLGK